MSVTDAATNRPLKRQRDIIKELFNPEMFSPEKILGKDSEKKILELVDVPVTKEDVKKLPVDIKDYDFTMPGLKVLDIIFNNMKNHREALSRDVKRSKGAKETAENNLSEKIDRFKSTHSVSPKDFPSIDKIKEDRIALEVQVADLNKNFNTKVQEYKEQQAKVVMIEDRIIKEGDAVKESQKKRDILHESIKMHTENISFMTDDLNKEKKTLEDTPKPDAPETQNDFLK